MSVVLRCPNCGTTRATTGECEACLEGPVRYFCTNHAPGVWLSEPSCPKCGARFGEPARAASVAAAARPARRPPARAAAPAPRSAPALPSRYPRAEYPVGDEAPDADGLAMAPWQKILSAALHTRAAAIAARESRRPPVGFGGCLRRLLLSVVLLLVAIVAALFFFGQALLQAFQP